MGHFLSTKSLIAWFVMPVIIVEGSIVSKSFQRGVFGKAQAHYCDRVDSSLQLL